MRPISDSTTVYQGVARQIADDPVTQINEFAVGDVVPDLTIILDIPAEVGLKESSTGFLICPIAWNKKTWSSMVKCVKVIYTSPKVYPSFFVVDGMGELTKLRWRSGMRYILVFSKMTKKNSFGMTSIAEKRIESLCERHKTG